MHPRTGLKKVDVAVGFLACVILVALCLPFCQHAKISTRTDQCQFNLKNIGTALLAYENQHRVFPPGMISWNPNRGLPKEDQLCRMSVAPGETCDEDSLGQYSIVSGLTMMLPYMDERSTFDQYNFDHACCSIVNATAVSQVIKTFICPSNPDGSQPVTGGAASFYRRPPGFTNAPARTDYGLSFGANAYWLTTCYQPGPLSTGGIVPWPMSASQALGAFSLNKCSSLKRMAKDGSSNIILVGEAVGGTNVAAGLGESGDLIPQSARDFMNISPIHGQFVSTPWSMGYVTGDSKGTGGWGSVLVGTAYDAWYNLSDGKGDIPPLALMNAFDAEGKSDPSLGFTPIKLSVGRQLLVRPTYVARNDRFASMPLSEEEDRFLNQVAHKVGVKPDIAKLSQVSIGGFRSFHDGFVIFVFGDGHVQRIAKDVDPKVLVGLSTTAGGEMVQP